MTAIGFPADAQAESKTIIRGKALHDSSTGDLAVGANTERGNPFDGGNIPFAISVDGDVVDESWRPGMPIRNATSRTAYENKPPRRIDVERKADIGLEAVDIQIKFDGLNQKPVLNVMTDPMVRTYQAGRTVTFFPTSNYPGFIQRAEIRINVESGGRTAIEPATVIPVTVNKRASWVVPTGDDASGYSYVLRVYDSQGRYDETLPLTLDKSERAFPAEPIKRPDTPAPGMGEDRTAVRNIPVNGGAVSVYGRNVPPGYVVRTLDGAALLDENRSFVMQRILPPGTHEVEVEVLKEGSSAGLSFSRSLDIPRSEWFYVGLADLTLGKRLGDSDIEAVRPGEYDNIYTKGRLAFYVKGKIKGKYLLTAAADTAEEDLRDILFNLDGKNPREILRNLDPDDYYPIYGDDSTMVEDAPTKGKFYIRLEKDDSRIMWGNYKTRITGSEFLRSERALYGAEGVYMSKGATALGERRTNVRVYAAQPDTMPQRDEFLATGGSAYFLKRQDIVRGSETLSVEIRDGVTGRVLERRLLQYGKDYRIDYIQGTVILSQPLSSSTGVNKPVRNGAFGGDEVYLTVQYEYVPSIDDVDGYAVGGRAEQWLGDHVRVGVTGMMENTGPADQKAASADIEIRKSERTFLRGEFARSNGVGFETYSSSDGGLVLNGEGANFIDSRIADAFSVEAQVDLEDVTGGDMQGAIGGYYKKHDGGFSTLPRTIRYDEKLWGVNAGFSLIEGFDLDITYDDYTADYGDIQRQGQASVAYQFDEYWKASLGLMVNEIRSPLAIRSGKSGYNGRRNDIGARIDYQYDSDHLYYLFGQGTSSLSGDVFRNDRIGLGSQIKVTDTIGLNGEISYGTHGLGVLSGLTYDPNANSNYYLGYKLDPSRAYDLKSNYTLVGSDDGRLVAGARRKLDDMISAYAESSYDMFGKRNSSTQAYGITYTPDALWTIDAGFEAGLIHDRTVNPTTTLQNADFDRYAPSISLGYDNSEYGVKGHVRGEVRIEESMDSTRDQTTVLLSTGGAMKAAPDWRILTNLDAVLSESHSPRTSYSDTDYVEASLGYAYRPVMNDRLNALFKYTWLYDLPGNNQLVSSSTGDRLAPAQRSHILSADTNYDLVPWLSIGGKYGFRYGNVRFRSNKGQGKSFEKGWSKSTAHLGVLRADLHVTRKWDVLLEGRVLAMPEAETKDYGTLAAVYRQVGNNFKIGLGYNFGRFSDDLRDLTLDDQGVFLNAVGKF